MSDIPMHTDTMAGLLVMGDTQDIASFFNEFGRQFQLMWNRGWLGADGGAIKIADGLDGNAKWLVDELHRAIERRMELEKQAEEFPPKQER